ncbi:Sac3p [Sporobolomyces salmoneus]|uniref:Sac3p n=1 Tax=Sporobolomyces salmoneus TaxID=183962 RepID=UPI00317A269F
MSAWRGGFKPAFPSSQPTTNGNPPNGFTRPSNNSTFPSFNPAAPSPFALGERGRGRGRGRGATRGVPSKRGGANLSWKRPESTTTTDETLETEEEQGEAEPTQSAFAAFGSSTGGGGGAFGSSNGFNPIRSTSASTTSAFGSTGSAFGSTGTFGGGGGGATTSSAFPPPSSAFGSTSFRSSFAPAPSAFSAAPPASTNTAEPTVDEDATEAVAETKRNPAQISTLEVLGEDSDARRKRFESTLPNNRYLELKPLREEQRLEAIKQGLIPDPSKPMRLDQATDFEGTCEEMCPEWEREEREYQNNVDPLERYPGTSRIDPSRAVKAFHRPAAGNDQPLPSDVRPPPILYKTLDYLFHTLLPQHPLAVTHPFVRDRTRSVRQDFTVQNVREHSAIECNERIARYHILALGTLREQSGFSESQELEQLRKVLKSLNEFYDDLRLSNPNVSLPNEAEFRSFHLLTHLRDPDIIWSTELLPRHVFSHPLLQTALQLHRLAQRSNLARGERASSNAFSRFFKLVESPEVPYLFGCILSTHFNEIRRNALDALKGAYLKQHSAFPLRTLTKLLGCDDEADTRSVCEQLGVVVRTDERGKLVAELHKGTILKSTTLKLKVSRRLVEAKRGSTSYQSVIDGANYSSQTVPQIPMTPSLASSSATFSAAQSHSRPTIAAPTPSFSSPFPAFGVPASTSLPSTTFPTPVPTPPPSFNAKPSLDATASPFVPTNSTKPPNVVPPPSSAFSFAPSSNSAPSQAQPAPPKAAPSFSFAPTATPFVPAPVSSAQPPVPNFFAPPPPSSSTVPPAPVPTAVASEPTPLSPAVPRPRVPSTVQPLGRISGTLAHASPRISTHPPVPAAKASPKVDRTPLINSLARSLTEELLREAIQGPVRRIGQEMLKERWVVLNETEEREKRKMGDELAEQVIREMGQMLVKEIGVKVRREEKLRKEVLVAWRERTRGRQERRKEGQERKKEWEEVMRGLGSQVRRAPKEEDDEMSDEEIFSDEEEDVGLAGDEEVDFELGGVSLSIDKADRRVVVGKVQPEEDLADKLRLAAESRQRIWARSTFLDILGSQLSRSLSHPKLPPRPRWTAFVLTHSVESPFATWLSCKFGLDEEERRATLPLPEATLSVQMIDRTDLTEQEDLDSTGLIILDFSTYPADELAWQRARAEFDSLIDDVGGDSIYKPALLILTCPSTTMNEEEEELLRQKISKELNLTSELNAFSTISIMLVRLEGAEAVFESETSKLLSSILVDETRIRRPLALYSKPLLTAWRTSVRSNLDRYKRDELAPSIVSSFVEQLGELVRDIENVVHPISNRPLMPPFPDMKGSFRSAVDEFISNEAFASAGHFPEIAAAFAQRPPVSDHDLARLLLDLLDQFTTNVYGPNLKTLQASLDQDLRPALQRLEDSLNECSQDIRREALRLEAESCELESTLRKKRKASITPTDSANRSPKKASNGQGNGSTTQSGPDRLTALEKLMKETKALLST